MLTPVVGGSPELGSADGKFKRGRVRAERLVLRFARGFEGTLRTRLYSRTLEECEHPSRTPGRGGRAACGEEGKRMNRRDRWSYAIAKLGCALLAACAAVQTQAQPIKRAPAFKGAELAAPRADTWATNGGDWYNRRYSPSTALDRDNVAKLKGVWRTHLRGSGVGAQYSGEAQPLVYRGVIYVSTGANDVFAVGVESGEILWEHRANLDPANTAVCCGWTSRGVSLGAGLVFAGQLDGKLVALDQRSGKVAWSVQAERWQEGYTITAAPLYYDGLVIVGFAGGERGIRGRVKAFSAKDGKLVWTFYTVPGPGEIGRDTWPQDNEIWQDGGAPVWNTPAVDPELGLIYFGTGNPGPDYNGSIRKGDNLFSTSIVALDAKTGRYRWHYQQVHHDIWDYDAASPVVLFDLDYGGVTRKAIAVELYSAESNPAALAFWREMGLQPFLKLFHEDL